MGDPESTPIVKIADKLDNAMFEWQSESTKTLKIWIDKGLTISTGKLIFASANLE